LPVKTQLSASVSVTGSAKIAFGTYRHRHSISQKPCMQRTATQHSLTRIRVMLRIKFVKLSLIFLWWSYMIITLLFLFS